MKVPKELIKLMLMIGEYRSEPQLNLLALQVDMSINRLLPVLNCCEILLRPHVQNNEGIKGLRSAQLKVCYQLAS